MLYRIRKSVGRHEPLHHDEPLPIGTVTDRLADQAVHSAFQAVAVHHDQPNERETVFVWTGTLKPVARYRPVMAGSDDSRMHWEADLLKRVRPKP